MKLDIREWSSPAGLVIQPGSILVPGREGWVASLPTTFILRDGWWPRLLVGECDPGDKCRWRGKYYTVDPVSVARWDLSGLTEFELDSLQVAIEAQRQRGIGEPCPATEADRLALGQITR